MKLTLLWFVIYLFFISHTFADNTDDSCMGANNYSKSSTWCLNKSKFELYSCRVKYMCNPCISKDAKKIFPTEEYVPAEDNITNGRKAWWNILDPFNKAQKQYKKNMNSIYKCVLIDIQERWLEYLEQVISATDKTNLVWKELNTKISSEKTKLKAKKSALKCGWAWEDDSDEKLIKKEVLDQATVEFCTYSFYLLYLREYYADTQNALWLSKEEKESITSWTDTTNESITTNEVKENSEKINKSINEELTKINKVFPLAYYAYSEYEDNYVLHLMLTLIKQDLVIAREQLAKVLWPINQVAYKIKDAMKKY